jgi:tellurite resistance protein TerC
MITSLTLGGPVSWTAFVVFVLAMLALDLGVFHRRPHAVTFREAAGWSAVWVALAFGFAGLLYGVAGPAPATDFVTGYLIEKSLSIDNVFVFVVIFGALRIAPEHQHRVLFWGVIGALVLRAAMIVGGIAVLSRFHWLVYVFGAFLVFTGIKLYVTRNATDGVDGRLMALVKRALRATDRTDGARFTTIEDGRRRATPLLVALVLVEITDVVFAVDSIPAIFAITQDTFLVFTSNMFAILGLRSLFFLLAGLVDRFRYLKVGLAGVLVFVGLKMSLVDLVKIPSAVSLAVIFPILLTAIVASHLRRERELRVLGAA